MFLKKEPCRNFQRGSCKYGDRCKFLHATPQQQKGNATGFGTQAGFNQQQKPNPFGFGVQGTESHSKQQQQANPFGFGQGASQQHQKPNPFGFGAPNSQSIASSDAGSKQNQFKPFQNKWTRDSVNASQQPGDRPQPKDHKCTDPASCKQIIVDDLKNERPLWKLTCYGHSKSGPCEIAGDISFEELRAVGYDDAKRGQSLQSICVQIMLKLLRLLHKGGVSRSLLLIERERSLLNSKLIEFENLLRATPATPLSSALAQQNSNPVSPSPSFPTTFQSNTPTGFAQQGPLNTAFSNSQGSFAPSAKPFGFGQPNSASSFVKPSGTSGIQQSNQFPSAAFKPNFNGFSNTGVNNSMQQFPSTASAQNSANGLNLSSSILKLTPLNVRSGDNLQNESIWLKEKWTPGEIPEEAPPDAYVH